MATGGNRFAREVDVAAVGRGHRDHIHIQGRKGR